MTTTSHAAVEGLRNIAQFASALEALIESLRLAPEKLNTSTTATVANSIDFLAELFDKSQTSTVEFTPQSNILVVDDEEVPRRNVVRALSTVKLSAISTDDPEVALKLLSENRFDLVFLDVEMPGLNGFELCAQLRKLPLHTETPVVFVTALTDFQARVRSKLSGGNEFIAKPFLMIELGVKALTHVMRQWLKSCKAEQAGSSGNPVASGGDTAGPRGFRRGLAPRARLSAPRRTSARPPGNGSGLSARGLEGRVSPGSCVEPAVGSRRC